MQLKWGTNDSIFFDVVIVWFTQRYASDQNFHFYLIAFYGNRWWWLCNQLQLGFQFWHFPIPFDQSTMGGGADHGHGHGEVHGDFRNKVWSMTGGPYCRPKHWKRNTAIAMVGVVLICIPIAMKSAELEVCIFRFSFIWFMMFCWLFFITYLIARQCWSSKWNQRF